VALEHFKSRLVLNRAILLTFSQGASRRRGGGGVARPVNQNGARELQGLQITDRNSFPMQEPNSRASRAKKPRWFSLLVSCLIIAA
jgi:hypothetical protein